MTLMVCITDHMSSHVTMHKASCVCHVTCILYHIYTADEPDTPGLDYVMGEGGEEGERGGEGEGGTHPKQFNQVMLQAQNRMVLIAVLSDQKEKASQTCFFTQLLLTLNTTDM